MEIYRIICVTSSVFTTPSELAPDRKTLSSRDYAQSRQILFKYGYMCYSLVAPAQWNLLPENIWSAETFATLKKSLKTFFFK